MQQVSLNMGKIMDKIQNVQEIDVKIVDKALTCLGERRILT